MSKLFEHRDSEGDGFYIRTTSPRMLKFQPNDRSYSVMHADQVRELHSALGRWLNENSITQERTPEPALHIEERVTVDDVRRIAADEIDKVSRDLEHAARRAAREELREMFRSYGNEGE